MVNEFQIIILSMQKLKISWMLNNVRDLERWHKLDDRVRQIAAATKQRHNETTAQKNLQAKSNKLQQEAIMQFYMFL